VCVRVCVCVLAGGGGSLCVYVCARALTWFEPIVQCIYSLVSVNFTCLIFRSLDPYVDATVVSETSPDAAWPAFLDRPAGIAVVVMCCDGMGSVFVYVSSLWTGVHVCVFLYPAPIYLMCYIFSISRTDFCPISAMFAPILINRYQ
jgi:hypothetical protein